MERPKGKQRAADKVRAFAVNRLQPDNTRCIDQIHIGLEQFPQLAGRLAMGVFVDDLERAVV